MKRIILFLILMISITTAAQDDYRPLLKNGKVWKEVAYSVGGAYKSETTYRVDGETVVNGKCYFNIYSRCDTYRCIDGKGEIYSDEPESEEEVLRCLLREEDGRIYSYYYVNQREYLLYDFNVKAGEAVYSEVYMGDKATGNYGELKRWVSGIDYIESSIGPLKRICLKNEVTNYSEGNVVYSSNGDSYLIEGVGYSIGLLHSVYTGVMISSRTEYLVDCLEDGESICTIADYDPLTAATSVPDVHMQRPATSQIFDLQGRRLNGVPTRGLYIKDGKKHVVR